VAAPRGVRTGTLILGLVLALAGFGALVTGLGYQLDLQLSVIVVLVVAAVALLLVPLLQRGRRDRDDEPAA
jgi:membrane protein implicated in regulation of membrane protease activity